MSIVATLYCWLVLLTSPAMDDSRPKKKTKTKHDKEKMLQHYKFVPQQILFASSDHITDFTCKISGVPRAQQRCFANTRSSAKKVSMINQSEPHCVSFRKAFTDAIAASKQTPFQIERGMAVKITVRFIFSRPRSHYRSVNKQLVLNPNCPTYVTKIPDIDNLLKLLLDALQGVCYKNDMTVAHIDSAKLYDSTQVNYRKEQVGGGCTLIRVSQINQNEAQADCTCLSCKAKAKCANSP
jgi:Holliday junction resolvase RusA-like endonuclease